MQQVKGGGIREAPVQGFPPPLLPLSPIYPSAGLTSPAFPLPCFRPVLPRPSGFGNKRMPGCATGVSTLATCQQPVGGTHCFHMCPHPFTRDTHLATHAVQTCHTCPYLFTPAPRRRERMLSRTPTPPPPITADGVAASPTARGTPPPYRRATMDEEADEAAGGASRGTPPMPFRRATMDDEGPRGEHWPAGAASTASSPLPPHESTFSSEAVPSGRLQQLGTQPQRERPSSGRPLHQRCSSDGDVLRAGGAFCRGGGVKGLRQEDHCGGGPPSDSTTVSVPEEKPCSAISGGDGLQAALPSSSQRPRRAGAAAAGGVQAMFAEAGRAAAAAALGRRSFEATSAAENGSNRDSVHPAIVSVATKHPATAANAEAALRRSEGFGAGSVPPSLPGSPVQPPLPYSSHSPLSTPRARLLQSPPFSPGGVVGSSPAGAARAEERAVGREVDRVLRMLVDDVQLWHLNV